MPSPLNKFHFYLLAWLLLLVPLCMNAQNWTEPVQINSLPGLNTKPDFCIGSDGTIHCVWSYSIEQFYRVIYYSKSTDDGISWSVPENVSQNESHWMENPHVAVDSKNQIHLTYDVNVQSPGNTHVVYRHFDGQSWSPEDTLSAGWPGSMHNRLVLFNNDKLYCFWFILYNNGTTFYRVLDNGIWSDIKIPYDNNDLVFFMKGVVDSMDNLYCTGSHHFEGQSAYDDRIIAFNYVNGEWSNYIQLSDNTSWGGNDIALDTSNQPSIVWRQYRTSSIPPNDGTLFSKFNGTNWSYPEIIVEDPTDQATAIDRHNNVHIVDNEKYENGYRLMHYQLINDEWVGEIIDEDNFGNYDNRLLSKANYLYMISSKAFSGSPNTNIAIVLRKYDITTNIKEDYLPAFSAYAIYPNPSSGNTTISYVLHETAHAKIKIYNLAGEVLQTLIDKKQPPGRYEINWNGTDQNGKEVKNGVYLIRLQAGRQIMTRSVVYHR